MQVAPLLHPVQTLTGTHRRPAVTHEVPPSPTCITRHHLGLPEANQHLQVIYLSLDMTYLHMLSALQGGPSIHQAGSLGSNHLCPKLYAQPVMPPSQYLGGGGGTWDPWIHGILSPRAEPKPSLFRLQPLSTSQNSALSD